MPEPVVIRTAHLFRPLARELIALLRSLSAESWSLPTSAAEWTVRDVVAHMLDGDVRRLSVSRDDHVLPASAGPIDTYADLLVYLNTLNAEWVRIARRMSPRVLTDLLELTSAQMAGVIEAADPAAPAVFAVAWAGQSQSPMWLDIGREYTERWHHQDQIREAVGAPPLAAPEWLRPMLEVSLLALPHAYRDVNAHEGTCIALSITGAGGGEWHLVRTADHWTIAAGAPTVSDCRIRMHDLDFARLLMHRLDYRDARARIHVDGSSALADALLHARAVMV